MRKPHSFFFCSADKKRMLNDNYDINMEQILHPPILYKFRDWQKTNHKTVLTDCTVHLSSPRKFSDTKDCRILEKLPEGAELREFFQETITQEDIPYEMNKEQFINYLCQHSPLANIEEKDKLNTKLLEEYFDLFGVLSMTTDYNNDSMWNEYANGYKGFCVGFDAEMLCEFMGGGGFVHYVDELPIIDYWKDSFEIKHYKRIYHKERKWEFEREYRLHKMWSSKATEEQRQIQLPTACIKEIYLGKLMSEKHKEEIKHIVEEKYSNAKFVELKKIVK